MHLLRALLFHSIIFFIPTDSSQTIGNATAEKDLSHSQIAKSIVSIYSKTIYDHLGVASGLHHGIVDSGVARKLEPIPHLTQSGLPHCSGVSVVTGQIINENIDEARVEILDTMHLQLGLKETACFYVEFDGSNKAKKKNATNTNLPGLVRNQTLLYTLQFVRLDDHHPVRASYQFGIPQVNTKCKCDCPGGGEHCQSKRKYSNCSSGAACYSLQHDNQRNEGCGSTSGQATLCCDVTLTPYRNWRFWMVHVGNPTAFAVFRYTVRQWHKERWLTIAQNDNVRLSLRSGKDFQLGSDKLELQVGGTVPRELPVGMYFIKNGEQNLRQGLLNRMHEFSLEKMGWFRFKDGSWSVRNGAAKLQTSHHVTVDNCKEQKYFDTYIAEFYVTASSDHIDTQWSETPHDIEHYLNKYVMGTESYILNNSIVMEDGEPRSVIISHRESQKLDVRITMDNKPTIRFFQTVSSFRDFYGKIQLDRYSNRFLNVTFIDAHGSLNGMVFREVKEGQPEAAVAEHALSHTLGAWKKPRNVSVLLALPSSVNSERYVCFYPSGFPRARKCHSLEFDRQPLYWFQVPKHWSEREGDCPGCNEFTLGNFWTHLNPRNWFNGVSSGVEALAMGFELFVYLIALLILFAIFRKCIYPLLKCALCSGGSKTPKEVKV